MERPSVRYGCAAQSKKGEDYFLMRTDCLRVPANPSTSFSVFAVLDGHNGNAAAIYTRDNLLNHVVGAILVGSGGKSGSKLYLEHWLLGSSKLTKNFRAEDKLRARQLHL
uniref:protein-serine/threonine phosphatase n=1 Tax=Ananas comosus var. bracteatus TaxID=296719 RepID=A0A6V7PW60_ANACO|nr:unnamed protein product [Ananas comosus var. bracteatus]